MSIGSYKSLKEFFMCSQVAAGQHIPKGCNLGCTQSTLGFLKGAYHVWAEKDERGWMGAKTPRPKLRLLAFKTFCGLLLRQQQQQRLFYHRRARASVLPPPPRGAGLLAKAELRSNWDQNNKPILYWTLGTPKAKKSTESHHGGLFLKGNCALCGRTLLLLLVL